MITLDDLSPDRNNQVYFDNDIGRFYIVIWEEGYYDKPYRFYIDTDDITKQMRLNPKPIPSR